MRLIGLVFIVMLAVIGIVLTNKRLARVAELHAAAQPADSHDVPLPMGDRAGSDPFC